MDVPQHLEDQMARECPLKPDTEFGLQVALCNETACHLMRSVERIGRMCRAMDAYLRGMLDGLGYLRGGELEGSPGEE